MGLQLQSATAALPALASTLVVPPMPLVVPEQAGLVLQRLYALFSDEGSVSCDAHRDSGSETMVLSTISDVAPLLGIATLGLRREELRLLQIRC